MKELDIYCLRTGETIEFDWGDIAGSMEEGDASILNCSQCGLPVVSTGKMGTTAMGVTLTPDHRIILKILGEEPQNSESENSTPEVD